MNETEVIGHANAPTAKSAPSSVGSNRLTIGASGRQGLSMIVARMPERAKNGRRTMEAPSWQRAAALIGLLLHGTTALLYAPSGLVAPEAGVAVLYGVWLLILALGVRWRRRNPLRVLALPGLSVGFWISAVSFGEAHLGWTG